MRKRRKISPFQKMIKEIRRTEPYLKWRRRILKRDIPTYPKVPKGMQVHHLRNFSDLLRDNNIESVEDAINCKALWKAEGMTLSRGEHSLLSKLQRYKYVSDNFIQLMLEEIIRLQDNKEKGYVKRKRRNSKSH